MFKKSFAMGSPLNGFNTKRPSSPVTMQDALATIASSGNLLSLGARQIVISSVGEQKSALEEMRIMAVHFSSSFKKYLSNFF